LRLRASCVLSVALFSSLCACGGGGGGGGGSNPVPTPPTPTPAATATPVTGPGTATFTLTPDATSSITSARRRPRYVSASTSSIAIVLNGAGTATFLNLGDATQCDAAKKCSVSIAAPAGNDTFLVSAYSGAGGTGFLLSRATVQATITSSGTTVVPVVLNGVVASITLSLATVNPPLHQALSDTLTVIAKDPAGKTIVGPGGYLYPITLTDSDTSGHSSLTKTTLNGPGDTVVLQYDGGYGAGSIGAAAFGAPSPSPVTFFPTITTTETTIPGGRTAHGLTVGPDGALWFVDSPFMIGRITTAGVLTEYAMPTNWNARALCTGPDGNLWITAQGTQFANAAIIRRTADGNYTVYQNGTPFAVGGCAGGPDGNVYAVFGANIAQVTPSGGLTTLTLQDANGSLRAGSVIAGTPDGGLWFVDTGYGALDRYDLTTHAVAVHVLTLPNALGSGPTTFGSAVLGPDRRFYFSEFFGGVYAADTSGAVTAIYVKTGGIASGALTFGADGALWFSTNGASQAGVPTFAHFSGGFTTPLVGTSVQSGFPTIDSMVAAPDGTIWYTRNTVVGKLVP
jgi:virginiamycin B lyase